MKCPRQSNQRDKDCCIVLHRVVKQGANQGCWFALLMSVAEEGAIQIQTYNEVQARRASNLSNYAIPLTTFLTGTKEPT